jgi:enterochelin esterase family protein
VSASRILSADLDSRVLAANPLGDPATRKVLAYLPPDYDDSSRRYPAVYLLAGFTRTGESFLQFQAWEETLHQRMDRLVRVGLVQPMLVILPDGFTRLGGSQYINSEATGRYQDYLLEIVEWADRTLRTVPDRSSRAVAGKSSGGFGALRAAMDHPEVFGLVADHSGDKYFEHCYGPLIPRFLRAVHHHDIDQVWADPPRTRPHDGAFFDIMEMLAYSASYSPNKASAFGLDLPVDMATGEIRPDVWSRWLAHDPVRRVEASAEALRSLRLLFVDCGRLDEYNMVYGCRLLHRRLDDRGIRHHYEEFDDGHFHTAYRYDVSLAAISDAIQRDR